MVINGSRLLFANPIRDMVNGKRYSNGVSYGLGEAGYDIRLKQEIIFTSYGAIIVDNKKVGNGRFVIASAIEEFHMPVDLMGIVHDKSTWARRGLSVFNTVIESGWFGWLTLELVYHGADDLHIPAGSGIAQVVFHHLTCPSRYEGRYQNAADRPQQAIEASNDELVPGLVL